MKRNLVLGMAALFVAGCVLLAMAWKASGAGLGGGSGIISTVNTARYNLVGGAYVTSAGQAENGVFKIDSYTGETWVLKVDKNSSGMRQASWVAIQAPPPPAAPPSDQP